MEPLKIKFFKGFLDCLTNIYINNKIYAAGLDVYEIEPINFDNPLLKMPNVVTLPHAGTATKKTRLEMCMVAAENLIKAVIGEVPPNVVPEFNK